MSPLIPPSSLSPRLLPLLQRRFGEQPDLSAAVPLHLDADLSEYHSRQDRFIQPGGIGAVWDTYTQQTLAEAFAGPRVTFLLAYGRQAERVSWRGEAKLPAFHPGLQVYCVLDLLGPRIIIGLEILRVDEASHEIEVCYLSGGLFRGTQVIRMEAISATQTRVIHNSYYFSGHFWLDRVAYPVFHRLTVGEFHQGVRQRLSQAKR